MSFRLTWITAISACAIILERATIYGWRLVTWCIGFAAVWIMGASSIWISVIALIGVGYFLYKDLRHFRLPRREEIAKRIERESGIAHRPLSSADDQPVGERDALWQREQRRKARLLENLKPVKPEASLASRDPYALRLFVIMGIVCAIFITGADWKDNMLRGALPALNITGGEARAPSATLWITPPDYTAMDRIIPEDGQTLDAPQGSIVKAIVQNRLTHTLRGPSISIDRQRFPLTRNEDGTYNTEFEIPEGERLSIRAGLFKTQNWTMNYIPDTPPQIEILEDPKPLSDGHLQFAIKLLDDYGVKTLNMRMSLDPVVEDAPLGWAVDQERSVLSPPKTAFQMSPLYDLSSHPWAGLPVVFTFTAHDHIDQIATATPVKTILPRRDFTHPVAKKLIEVRKYLIWNPDGPYPESALAIEGLLQIPQRFGHDPVIYLALRSAALRLYYNEPNADIAQSVINLLWDTALQLEDGNLSLASRDLRDAQHALQDALNDPNTSDEEIAALTQRVREALSEYLQAMAREFQKRIADGEALPQLPPNTPTQMLDMEDLAELLDRMESEALSGERGAAQDLLSKLQRFMDMTNPSASREMPPDMQMMQEGINELQELIEKQESLRDQTEKQAELLAVLDGLDVDIDKTKIPPFIKTEKNRVEQEALRTILSQLMLDADAALNEIPENLGLAEQAMRGSSEELGANRPDLSAPFQNEAIKHLRESQQQMAQQLAQRMQQMTGFALGSRPQSYDPLGRPMGNDGDGENEGLGSEVEVPSEAQKKWVQDILNELRRRAGQRDRPPEELEYYRRLLKRF